MVMLGPFNSSVAKAMMPKLNTAGLCNISPANTNETLTKPEFGATKDLRPTGNVTYFRVVTTDDVQGPAEADYAYTKLGLKNVYILDDTEAYGKGIADNFEKQFIKDGGKVLGHDGVPKGTTDYSSILTKIAATKADLIYYGGTWSNNIPLARKQMKGAGLDHPVDGWRRHQGPRVCEGSGCGRRGGLRLGSSGQRDHPPRSQAVHHGLRGSGVQGSHGSTTADLATRRQASRSTRSSERPQPAATGYAQLSARPRTSRACSARRTFDENGDTSNKVISFYEVKGGDWQFVDQLKFETK